MNPYFKFFWSCFEIHDSSFIPGDYTFKPTPTKSYLLHDILGDRYSLVTEVSGKYIHFMLDKSTFMFCAMNLDIIVYMINHPPANSIDPIDFLSKNTITDHNIPPSSCPSHPDFDANDLPF